MSKQKEALDEVLDLLKSENLNLDNLEDKFNEKRSEFEELVRAHPLLSVAIALGTGYVIAKILNPKGRR